MIYCVISVMSGIIGFLLGAIIGHADGYDKGAKEVCDYYNQRGVSISDKMMPCPFCGGKVIVCEHAPYKDIECTCGYTSMLCDTDEFAIAAHNRVCRAVEVAM